VELTSEIVSVKALLELKKSSMLIINSEYQRGAVWTETQQKKLIDSVMRGYPLPLIYLHHKVREVAGMRNEGLEIIDGQQRIDALYAFAEGAFKLFDPIKDDRQARFPNFIKGKPCPWARCDFLLLEPAQKERFLATSINVVKIKTDDEDEARDLFIRLQAGLPLNAQEKRDAWPGGLTQLVLQLGGKRGLTRFPGHDFFKNIVKIKSTDRGEIRQLCAQICMLVFERLSTGAFVDISSKDIDDYYYRHLDFDLKDPRVTRLTKTLDLAVQIFEGKGGPRLKAHEAIHIVLLLDSLRADYDKSWISKLHAAYDGFKQQAAAHKAARAGEYWFEYGALTQTQSDQARTIQRRHAFFLKHMLAALRPKPLDEERGHGEVEREIVFYRQGKKCAVCDSDLKWSDMEIHHVEEHHKGGPTTLENAAAVHKDCHPKGQKAVNFAKSWKAKLERYSSNTVAPETAGDVEDADADASPRSS
jgi:hypothetical protein